MAAQVVLRDPLGVCTEAERCNELEIGPCRGERGDGMRKRA